MRNIRIYFEACDVTFGLSVRIISQMCTPPPAPGHDKIEAVVPAFTGAVKRNFLICCCLFIREISAF